MNDCEALETNTEPTEVMQPRDSALNDPAGLPETAAVGHPSAGNFGFDTRSVQWLAVLVMIVAAVALNYRRLLQRSSAFAADGRNGFDQRNELSNVVPIGPRQDDRERDPLRFGDEMVLGAWASAVGGIRSSF